MPDLKIFLGHFISDKGEPIFDVLSVLPSAHYFILYQQYGGLVILIQDIVIKCVPLSLHEIFVPHHHPKNIHYTYRINKYHINLHVFYF